MQDILKSYAVDLNDAYPGYEFSNWSKKQLLGWFNEALASIAAIRPELFTNQIVVEVSPASPFVSTKCCPKLRRVIGQSTKEGVVLRPLIRVGRTNTTWTGVNITGSLDNSTLSSYDLDERTGLLQFFPRLSPGKPAYVLVECSGGAPEMALDDAPPDISSEFFPAIRHMVLFNAKMMDAEFSPTMASAAKDHLAMFKNLMELFKVSYDQFTEEEDHLEPGARRG